MSRQSAFLLATATVVLLIGSLSAADPPKPKDGSIEADTGLRPDLLPEHAVARLGTSSFRHHGRISALACSPDGKVLATATSPAAVRWGPTTLTSDSYILLWDNATGKELRRWVSHRFLIVSLAFSPDGKILASLGAMGTEEVRLWDVATGKMLRAIAPAGNGSLTFSPDGKMLAVGIQGSGKEGSIYLYDVETAKEICRFVPPGKVAHIGVPAFSPDGKTLAGASVPNPENAKAGTPDTVYLWDVATGRLLHSCQQQPDLGQGRLSDPPGGVVRTVAFSPDGKLVAAGGLDGKIHYWDAATGREVRTIQTKSGSIKTVAFSFDGKLLASTGPEQTVLWDVATSKELRQLGERFCEGRACVFSSDGQTLACTAAHAIRLYRVTTGEELTPPDGHTKTVEHVSFSPDGKSVLTVGGTAWLWDAGTGKGQPLMKGDFLADCGSFSPDGRTVVLGSPWQQSIRLWDVASRKEIRPFTGGMGRVVFVQFLPDGKTVIAVNQRISSEDVEGRVRLWDVASGKEKNNMAYSALGHVALRPDGKVLVAYGMGSATSTWEVATGRQLLNVKHFLPLSASITPDGRRMAVLRKFGIYVWEVASGTDIGRIAELRGEEFFVVAVSPDARFVATGGKDHAVRIWDVESGKELRCMRGHRGTVVSLAFSPDGKKLVSGSTDTTAMIWDLSGFPPPEKPALARLADGELKELWANLAGEAPKAMTAVRRLTQDPEQVVAFVQKQLRSVPLLDEKKFAQLIEDLDSDKLSVREQATAELTQLGEWARGALMRAQDGRPGPEVARRIEQILSKLPPSGQPPPELLRVLRAVEVLERIGTPEARLVVESLAKSAADPQVADDAKETLERLQKKVAAGR